MSILNEQNNTLLNIIDDELLFINACYKNDLSHILHYLNTHDFNINIHKYNIFGLFIKYLDNIHFHKLLNSYNFSQYFTLDNISSIFNVDNTNIININNNIILENITIFINHVSSYNCNNSILFSLYEFIINKIINLFNKSIYKINFSYILKLKQNLYGIKSLILSKINNIDEYPFINIVPNNINGTLRETYRIKTKFIILFFEPITNNIIDNIFKKYSITFSLDENIIHDFTPDNTIIYIYPIIFLLENLLNVNIIDFDIFKHIISYIITNNNIYDKNIPYIPRVLNYSFNEQLKIDLFDFFINALNINANIVYNNCNFIFSIFHNIVIRYCNRYNFHLEIKMLNIFINSNKINYLVLDDKLNNILLFIFKKLSKNYNATIDYFHIHDILNNTELVNIFIKMINQYSSNINFKNYKDKTLLYYLFKIYHNIPRICDEKIYYYDKKNHNNIIKNVNDLIYTALDNNANMYDDIIMNRKKICEIANKFIEQTNSKSASKIMKIDDSEYVVYI